MNTTLEIIYSKTRDNTFELRIIKDGIDYDAFRKDRADSHLSFCLQRTAERHGGFRYIANRRSFVTAFGIHGDEPLKLIAALRRQGHSIVERGSLKSIDELMLEAA